MNPEVTTKETAENFQQPFTKKPIKKRKKMVMKNVRHNRSICVAVMISKPKIPA